MSKRIMKKQKFILLAFCLMSILSLESCNNSNTSKTNRKKFNPQQEESTMTDAERKAAIEAKRASLSVIDTATIIGNGIKLTIMTPNPDQENFVSKQMSEELAMRMLSVASRNGISGMGGDPSFVFAAGITGADKKLTGTAPQKTMITYNVTLYVGNVLSDTVFGTTTLNLVGVGDNEKQAAINAAREFKDNSTIQNMLNQSTKKIIDYYNTHTDEIKSQVNGYISTGKYDEAYAILRSVPQEATETFKYAQSQLESVGTKMLEKHSTQTLANLKAAISASTGSYNPEIGAYLAMIPSNSPQYKEAQSIYDNYSKNLNITQEQDKMAARELEMKKMELAAKSSKQMSSSEMRRRIALEDAQNSPFRMLWYKLCYGLGDKVSVNYNPDAANEN